MQLQIFWSDRLKISPDGFKDFIQKMANRYLQGYCRYGKPDRRKQYLTRLNLEIKAYEKTGNVEHLYNAANYCLLEMEASEHENFHFDNKVESVTRDLIWLKKDVKTKLRKVLPKKKKCS